MITWPGGPAQGQATAGLKAPNQSIGDNNLAMASASRRSALTWRGSVTRCDKARSASVCLAQRLLKVKHPIQVVFICGKNEKLKTEMDSLRMKYEKSAPVVPLPMNGSRIVCGFDLHLSMHHSINFTGFWVGCSLPGSDLA